MTIWLITASIIVPILKMKDPKFARKYLDLVSLHTIIYAKHIFRVECSTWNEK